MQRFKLITKYFYVFVHNFNANLYFLFIFF